LAACYGFAFIEASEVWFVGFGLTFIEELAVCVAVLVEGSGFVSIKASAVL